MKQLQTQLFLHQPKRLKPAQLNTERASYSNHDAFKAAGLEAANEWIELRHAYDLYG